MDPVNSLVQVGKDSMLGFWLHVLPSGKRLEVVSHSNACSQLARLQKSNPSVEFGRCSQCAGKRGGCKNWDVLRQQLLALGFHPPAQITESPTIPVEEDGLRRSRRGRGSAAVPGGKGLFNARSYLLVKACAVLNQSVFF